MAQPGEGSQTSFVVIRTNPKVVKMEDDKGGFGELEELTSRELGAERVNVVRISLWCPDFLHYHEISEETYICLEGEGELFLGDRVIRFNPGTRSIIRPGTLHAARPRLFGWKLVFLCVSSPAFDPADVYNDPVGRRWYPVGRRW